jgi:hypothetical protein
MFCTIRRIRFRRLIQGGGANELMRNISVMGCVEDLLVGLRFFRVI